MRSALFILSLAAATAAAQINPGTQIRWPVPSCLNASAFYEPATNLCVTVTTTGGLPTNNPEYTGTLEGPNANITNLNGSTISFLGMISSPTWGTGTNNLAGYYNNATNCGPPNTRFTLTDVFPEAITDDRYRAGHMFTLSMPRSASMPCAAVADPSYGNTDAYNLNSGALSNTSMATSQATLLDFRNGAMTFVSHNPGMNPGGNGYNDSILFACEDSAFQGTTGNPLGWNSASSHCLDLVFNNREPGFNLGNGPIGPGGWSVHQALPIQMNVSTPGISQLISGSFNKSGIGDVAGYYLYTYNYGGATASADEGLHLGALQGGEANVTYAGTITTGGTGATLIKVNCTNDCSNPGDGRYLIDTRTAIASGYVQATTGPSGETPGTVTINGATVPVSKFWGTLNATVNTPVSSGSQSTAMTFAVTQTGGTGAPVGGDLICFSGSFHEQAKITSVSGTGPYTIVANLRHAHGGATYVYDGGACGTFADVPANQQTPQGQMLRWPIDILGSTSSTTLVYRYFGFGYSPGQLGYGFPMLAYGPVSGMSMVNRGGLVTMDINTNQLTFAGQANLYISGASDSAFNGLCTNSHVTSWASNLGSGTIACTQTSSNGHTGTQTGSVTVGTSQYYSVNLYAGAEVVDVLDYTISPPSLDGTFTLEPNTVAWTSGDSVEEPHHYMEHADAVFDQLQINNPFGYANGGYDFGLQGAGISGGTYYCSTCFAAMKISNTNPASMYSYGSGLLTAPNGIDLLGPFTTGINMYTAPSNGNPFSFIGCPAVGCNDPGYMYHLFAAATYAASPAMSIFQEHPFQSAMDIGQWFRGNMSDPNVAGNLNFQTAHAPQNAGSKAIAGGTLPDTTTYYYYVIANVASGTSLRSTEFSVTTGTSSGKNGVHLQWTYSPGANSYTICRGSSTGTEQALYSSGPQANWQGYTNSWEDYGSAAPSGACPGATDTSLGGIYNAGYVSLKDPNSTTQANLKSSPNLTGNYNYYLPVISFDSTLTVTSEPALTATQTISGVTIGGLQNYVQNAATMTGTGWSNIGPGGLGTTTGGQTDPYGGTNAISMVTGAGWMQWANQPTPSNLTAGIQYVACGWLKGATGTERFQIQIGDQQNSFQNPLTTSWKYYGAVYTPTSNLGLTLAITSNVGSTTMYAYGWVVVPGDSCGSFLATGATAVTTPQPEINTPNLNGNSVPGGGAGFSIPNTAVTSTAVNHATCWKTTTQIGYCSTQPDATGACTCN
jgi:hypothetical protein